jgi:hypothetical protein
MNGGEPLYQDESYDKVETRLRRLLDAALISTGASTAPLSPGGKNSSGGMRLSPWFVEWMMGAPEGWTDPECPLSAMGFSCRRDGSSERG